MKEDRRKFLKNTAIIASGTAVLKPLHSWASPPKSALTRLRVALIGVGLRGQTHLSLLCQREDVDIVAICDIDPIMLESAKQILEKNKRILPRIYDQGDHAYQRLLADGNVDVVIISTPWEWHKPMIIDALKAGIRYIGTEVILGITVEDHWDVVKASERYNGHVMMLENVCYRRDVMACLNMVRQGLFGELLHLQGGYQHDLRGVKFNDGIHPYDSGVEFGAKGFSEARWRTNHSVNRNGDLYPTHGLGPLAMMIDINRGNRFMHLSSYATKSRGLHKYIVDKGGSTHPNAKVNFRLGDIVTTQIQCANGETIFLQHDTNSPRPYSLGFRVQGTDGLWMDINKSIYVEGKSKRNDQWDDQKEWFDKYDHPLWKRWAYSTKGAGHGGMDFFVIHALIESAKRGTDTPMDVYDAASWSVITPLSEASIKKGNRPVDIPDFTQGKWSGRKNTFAIGDEY